MDARTPSDEPATTRDEDVTGVEAKLSAYGRAKRRRERIRKIIRGAVGIATVLLIWQVMAVAYDLQHTLSWTHHRQYADAELRASLALRPEHL